MIRSGGLRRARRRRSGGVGAAALGLMALAVVVPATAEADDVPVADSCKLHPVWVVNPGCASALAEPVADPGETYPDLVPTIKTVAIPPFGSPEIQFDTWSQNLGTVALDLLVDNPALPGTSTASQCVTWSSDRVCRERRQVGGFVWHDDHTHFHFDDFARYELRRLLADGTPDYSESGVVGRSEKVSFCLIDTTPVREDAFPVPTYTLFCNPFRQGISPGWADVYGQAVPGQQFSLEGLVDGRYALIVELNPTRALWESDYDNNRAVLTVELSGGLTEATIVR